jgi:hypothetical protein
MFEKVLATTLVACVSTGACATDVSLEPCINGGVSPSGTYPSEAIERGMRAYHNWRTYDPYYLFAVSADYLQPPFDEPDQADPYR